MGFLVGFVTAMISGLFGAVAAAFAADAGTRAQGVSNFEGGRIYTVVFGFIPLGFVAGVGIGALVSFVARGRTLWGFARQTAIAVLITVALIAASGALAVLSVDHPPSIDGHALSLDLELRIPDAPTAADVNGFTAGISSESDNRLATLGLDRIEVSEGRRVIPGSADLATHDSQRALTVGPSGWKSQVFDIKLPSTPRKEDTAWSSWIRPRSYLDGKPVGAEDAYELRYRLRIAPP